MFLNLPRSEGKSVYCYFYVARIQYTMKCSPRPRSSEKKPVGEKAPFPTDEVQPPCKAWYNIQLANVQETFCHALFT